MYPPIQPTSPSLCTEVLTYLNRHVYLIFVLEKYLSEISFLSVSLLCPYLFLSVSASLYLSRFVCMCLSLYISLSPCVCVCVCLSLCLSFC